MSGARAESEMRDKMKAKLAKAAEALEAAAEALEGAVEAQVEGRGGRVPSDEELGLCGAPRGAAEAFLAELAEAVEADAAKSDDELLAERVCAAAMGVDRHELPELLHEELPLEGVQRVIEAAVSLYVAAKGGDAYGALFELSVAIPKLVDLAASQYDQPEEDGDDGRG